MNPKECLIDNMQARVRKEPVYIRHTAICRVLDRQHRQVGMAGFQGLNNVFKAGAGVRRHLWSVLLAGLM